MLVIFFETKKRSIFKTFRKRFRVAYRAFRLAQNRVHRISHIKDTYRKKILPQPAQICAGKKTIGIPAAKNFARRYLNLQSSQPQRLKATLRDVKIYWEKPRPIRRGKFLCWAVFTFARLAPQIRQRK